MFWFFVIFKINFLLFFYYGSGIQDNSDNAKYTLESLVLACSLDIHGNRRNLQLATDITYILHKKLAKVSNISIGSSQPSSGRGRNMKVITVMNGQGHVWGVSIPLEPSQQFPLSHVVLCLLAKLKAVNPGEVRSNK